MELPLIEPRIINTIGLLKQNTLERVGKRENDRFMETTDQLVETGRLFARHYKSSKRSDS